MVNGGAFNRIGNVGPARKSIMHHKSLHKAASKDCYSTNRCIQRFMPCTVLISCVAVGSSIHLCLCTRIFSPPRHLWIKFTRKLFCFQGMLAKIVNLNRINLCLFNACKQHLPCKWIGIICQTWHNNATFIH